MEKQTLEQFGASIKAKYPEYADYSDAEIGQKMLIKYPQYKNNVVVPEIVAKPKTIMEKVSSVAQGISDFVGAKGITEQFGADIARMKAPKEQKNLVEYPSLKKVIGSAIQTGANLIPGVGSGASLATKAAVGAGTGYAFDVGSKLQGTESVGKALIPGAGTVVGAVLPVIGKITGISGASKNLKSASNKLEELNLRLTPVDKQNLGKQGKDIVNYLAEKKIVGSPTQRYSKVKTLYDNMEKTVQSVIEKHPETYNKTEIINQIKEIPNLFADDPAGYDEAVRATDKIMKFIQDKAPADIPATLLNKYKRSLFNRAYSKNNVDVVNETYHAIGSLFKDTLDKSITQLQNLNKEYGNLIVAKKILFKAQSRPQIGLVGKAVSGAAGGLVGGLFSGPVGAAAGTVIGPTLGQTVAGTAVRSAMGAGLRDFSQLINKLPTDKMGNISKKALLNLIELSSR